MHPAADGKVKMGDVIVGVNASRLVLSCCRLNNRNFDDGRHQAIRDACRKAGLVHRCVYFSSPTAGHEFDLYHLNEIMAFFDKHCKEPAPDTP